MQRKGVLPGKIFAPCVPERRFAGAFRMHGAHILPKPAHFGCMARESCRELAIFPSEATFGMRGAKKLPRIAARGRTAAESCHGKTPENASRESIATASQAESASGRNPATVGRWETHLASILPSSSARERTVVKSCHYQSPENAFRAVLPSPGAWECIASISCHRQTSENAQRRHTSTASRPVAQRSPREGMGSVPWLCCGVRRATLSVRGSGHSAFSGLNCWERLRVCAVSVGNHEPASRSAKLCRIMC